MQLALQDQPAGAENKKDEWFVSALPLPHRRSVEDAVQFNRQRIELGLPAAVGVPVLTRTIRPVATTQLEVTNEEIALHQRRGQQMALTVKIVWFCQGNRYLWEPVSMADDRLLYIALALGWPVLGAKFPPVVIDELPAMPSIVSLPTPAAAHREVPARQLRLIEAVSLSAYEQLAVFFEELEMLIQSYGAGEKLENLVEAVTSTDGEAVRPLISRFRQSLSDLNGMLARMILAQNRQRVG